MAQHRPSAFTLVELMVVLAVIGIIAGMSVPGLAVYAKQMRLKTAAQQVMGLLVLARSTAITRHTEHTVVIDPAQGRVSVIDTASGETLDQAIRLPAGVTIALSIGGEPAEESQLVFRPTGALSGRSVALTLEAGDRQQTVTVMSTTGAVALER